MSKPAAIKATFVDLKSIKGRKVAQLWFEIPLEQVDAALNALGGWPMPDKEIWCAIARLDISSQPEKSVEPVKERRAFHELPMVTQAGIRCKESAFQNFMTATCELDCITRVHSACGVSSRKEILPGTDSGRRWVQVLRDFEGIR